MSEASQTPMDWLKIDESDPNIHVVDLRCWYKRMPPLEAAIHTVKRIVATYPAPYTLMLSGGIDSQVMLYAWHKSGYDFKTRSVRYNGHNDHDLEQLKQFTDAMGVEVEFMDFDLLPFLQNEYDSWSKAYDCSSPQICTHMKMCSDIEGTAVFSGNYAEYNYAFINFTTMGMVRYAQRTGKSIVPFFMMETPELAFSFLPILKSLPSNLTGYDKKIAAYQEAGFPVVRQDEKFTGFEKVKDYYDVHYSKTVTFPTKLKYASKASRRTFDLILRYPYEDLYGNPRYVFNTNWFNHSLSRGSR